MDATKIEEAIKSIPEKKENLRKAFETLQSCSSSLAHFTLQWKDLDDHISSIESSILNRFKALQQSVYVTTATTTAENDDDNDNNSNSNNITPSPELKSLCTKMDAKGLRFYVNDHRGDLPAIRDEIAVALKSAPDPALLILNSMDAFYRPTKTPTTKRRGERKDRRLQMARRTCVSLLECLYLISPGIGIKPVVKERALKLAVEWKRKIPWTGDTALTALGFLQLIVSYGLVSEFELDDVMELFAHIPRGKQAVDLIKGLGLMDKAQDLIQKLSSKGRKLDAVSIAYAFNMVDKFPPVPLLKAYIAESEQKAIQLRREGNYTVQAQNDATAKVMGALKSVLNSIEEFKLEREYPRENLLKRIAQLENQKKADKKRAAVSIPSSSSETQHEQQSKKRTTTADVSNSKTQQQQQLNKRPCQSPSSSAPVTSTPVIASNSYSPLHQLQFQLELAERVPYMDVAGPYGLAATGSVYSHGAPSLSGGVVASGSVYDHGAPSLSSGLAATGSVYNHGGWSVHCTSIVCGGPGLSGIAMGQGGTRSPPRSYYSSESLGGTSSSLYDMAVKYHGYPLAGQPSAYVSSLYP